MVYRSSFQCPVTGETVIAHYAFGRLYIRAAQDDDWPVSEDTVTWCKKHSGKRFKKIDAASDHLVRIGEGQTFGLEETDY